MRILHISDLHITGKNTSLDQVWTAPARVLDGQLFDFIIVSGDLSQASAQAEYESLIAFTRSSLLPLLGERSGDPTRVIFVPGNHDVSWDEPVYKPVRFSELSAKGLLTLQEQIKALRQSPETSNLRNCFSDAGHLELAEIDDGAYCNRLSRAQKHFFDEIYKGAPAKADDKRFSLTDRTGKGDWSAHVFPEESVAFIGLSSCSRNDRYWHGASFHPAAVRDAQRHVADLLRRHRDMLIIGVWHHGFASEAGRPDRLDIQEIGKLYNIGIRVGFHGHTHVDDMTVHHLLGEKIPIIATGSLGAGADDLPPGTTNQFSIVNVYPGRVDVERFQMAPRQGIDVPLASKRRVLFDSPRYRPASPEGGVRYHRRRFRVNEDGIIAVEVQMLDVDVPGALPLAVVSPPFCSVSAGEIITDHGTFEVERTELPDNRIKIWKTDLRSPRKLDWTYYISNAVALTSAELPLLPVRRPWYSNIETDEDARSHTVRIHCDELDMSLELSNGLLPVRSARVLVERRHEDGHESYWQVDPTETKRASARFVLDELRREMSFKVAAPLLGARYSIVFRPGETNPYPHDAGVLGDTILDFCRGDSASSSDLNHRLTSAVNLALQQALSTANAVDNWTGLIWSGERRKLFTAFGKFAPQSWSSRFHAGDGVAGHAFRHGYPVAWRRSSGAKNEADRRVSTIYQEMPAHRDANPQGYQWLLCLPLLLAQKRGDATEQSWAIGVVGIARRDARTTEDRQLRDLAEALHSKHEAKRHLEIVWALRHLINVAFWTTLADASELSKAQREFADACLSAARNLKLGTA